MIQKPVIYLAGKIAPRDWRERVLRNQTRLPGHEEDFCHSSYPRVDENKALTPYYQVQYRDFTLAGPFFVSCDHGCSHGPATHGAGLGCSGGAVLPSQDAELTQRKDLVHLLNKYRIRQSNCVFAYIDEMDCYGTLAELVHASDQGKFVGVCYGPRIRPEDRAELWFVERFATKVFDAPVEKAFLNFLKEQRCCSAMQGSVQRKKTALDKAA